MFLSIFIIKNSQALRLATLGSRLHAYIRVPHLDVLYYHFSGNAKSTSNAKWISITAEHAALLIPLGIKIYATIIIQGHFFYKEKPSMGAYRKYTRGVKQ